MAPKPASQPRLPRGLLWVVAGAAVIIIGWQVLNGVFVKSINAPGGASVTFYPRHDAATGQNVGNTVKQDGGTGNRANVVGSYNRVEQSGRGNSAVIGGLPATDSAPADTGATDGRDGADGTPAPDENGASDDGRGATGSAAPSAPPQ